MTGFTGRTWWETKAFSKAPPERGLAPSGRGRVVEEDTQEQWRRVLERLDGRAVSARDVAYPAGLRDLPLPPPLVFLSGPWNHAGPAVAIVGARNASDDGCDVARAIAGDLAREGIAVLSGLARGIDAAAHEGALDAGGRSGAVLGTGLERCYPVGHRGLQDSLAASIGLLTEQPPGAHPTRGSFASRNRLLAAISDAVLLVQGREGSGALLTAEVARRLGRPIGAVPWDSRDPLGAAPHALIRSGSAVLVRGAEDVLTLLGKSVGSPTQGARPARRARPPAERDPVGEREQRLLRALRERPQPLDAVARQAALSIEEAGAALVLLELLGRARREPGGAVRRLSRG